MAAQPAEDYGQFAATVWITETALPSEIKKKARAGQRVNLSNELPHDLG